MFARREKINLQLASYYTINDLLKNTDMVYFKIGRRKKDYILTDKKQVLEEVKHSFMGADILKKFNKWYVCIPYINDIV